jgi:RNA-directed DNA polymerase
LLAGAVFSEGAAG